MKKLAGRIARPTHFSVFKAFVARAISPRCRFEEKLNFFNSVCIPSYSMCGRESVNSDKSGMPSDMAPSAKFLMVSNVRCALVSSLCEAR